MPITLESPETTYGAPGLPSAAPPRLLSPVLARFAHNPFRVLRLDASATTDDAAVQAERQLTLARAGFLTGDDIALPWLPEPDLHQMQQAAHAVEESLARLVEQLLWFDSGRDPNHALLEAGLRASGPRGEALQTYLRDAAVVRLPAGVASPFDRPVPELTEEQAGQVASAIDTANLMLVTASAIHSGLAVASVAAAGTRFVRISPGSDGDGDSKAAAPGPGPHITRRLHEKIGEALAGGGSDGDSSDSGVNPDFLWRDSLLIWMKILRHPWFPAYVRLCLVSLDDPHLQPEDAEVVLENIPVQLADLFVQEARHFLGLRRYAEVSALLRALDEAHLEPRALNHALRPLHAVFEGEIGEINRHLDTLLDSEHAPVFDASDPKSQERVERYNLTILDSHIKRLEALSRRWLLLDSKGVLGLPNFLNDAIEQTFLHARRELLVPLEETRLCERLQKIAGSASLRERIGASQTQIQESQQWHRCHYCKQRPPDIEHSAVLQGKRYTGTTYGGSVTTTHYELTWRLIARCTSCARLHGLIVRAGLFGGLICLCLILPTIAMFVALSQGVKGDDFLAGFASAIGIGAFGFAVLYVRGLRLTVLVTAPYVFGRWVGTKIAARACTPKNHIPCGDYAKTDAERELRTGGYNVNSTDFRFDAFERMKNKQKK